MVKRGCLGFSIFFRSQNPVFSKNHYSGFSRLIQQTGFSHTDAMSKMAPTFWACRVKVTCFSTYHHRCTALLNT